MINFELVLILINNYNKCHFLYLLSHLVLVEPVEGLLDGGLDLVLVIALELVLQVLLFHAVAHVEAVVLQPVLGFDSDLVRLVLVLVLLGLIFLLFFLEIFGNQIIFY